MNREERRRAERQQRRAGRQQPGANPGSQTAPAATVFAHGAGVLTPDPADPGVRDLPPLFVVLVNDDESTYRPAPVLRRLFDRLDRGGSEQLEAELDIAASWSVLTRTSNSLVKLSLDVRSPVRGSAHIGLVADNYAEIWQHVAGGGMVGITTPQRMQTAQTLPGSTLADAIAACIPVRVPSSPGLQQLIRLSGWPAGHLTT